MACAHGLFDRAFGYSHHDENSVHGVIRHTPLPSRQQL